MDNTDKKNEMTEKRLLSIHDIIRELNFGTAVTKFILNRFNHRFLVKTVKGYPGYSPKAVFLMLRIKEFLDAGMLPSQIDELLETDPDLHKIKQNREKSKIADRYFEKPNEDIHISKDLITSLFKDMGEHQKKIALAHEKRAEAEEKKAIAIEKRAAAEEKKAAAMNKIAEALQEMTRHRNQNPAIQAVTHEAARAVLSDMEYHPESCNKLDIDNTNELDDLYALVKELDTPDDLTELLDTDTPLHQIDAPANLDDLDDLDDLELLLNDNQTETTPLDMDNLSLLIQPSEAPDLDDLSLLIKVENENSTDTKHVAPDNAVLDDLTALVDTISSKPDISRDQDIAEYKAAVMKIIMTLKTDGLSAEETARRLNQDKVETISGKPAWTVKAISQIFKFIDAAS